MNTINTNQAIADQITQEMIDGRESVACNQAAATNGIAMRMVIPAQDQDGDYIDVVVYFDLAGREQDDLDVYTVANIISTEVY